MLGIQNLKRHFRSYRFYNRVLVGFIMLYTINAHAQSNKKPWTAKFIITAEYGISFPSITKNNSLTIASYPTNPQPEITFQEAKVFNETLSNTDYFGVQLGYTLVPKLVLGIAMQYRDGYNYNSSMLYIQKKEVPANSLFVNNSGVFYQHSKISSTSLMATVHYKLFECKLNQSLISLETGTGLGLSFMTLKSRINDLNLTMEANNNNTSQVNILGPGMLYPETERFSPFTWQINTGLTVQFKNRLALKIGYRFAYIGHFTILKRPLDQQNLFSITSTITGTEDQNLVLKTTNKNKKIYANDLFITFSF